MSHGDYFSMAAFEVTTEDEEYRFLG